MSQVIVTARQALCEIAELMLAQETDRACEADLHTAIDEQVLEPLRALEAVVDQLTVAAE